VSLQVLGLQAAVADGGEPTFDGQAMTPGVHLRWSFDPRLGFPPGAFWLLRRSAPDGEQQIPPPVAVSRVARQPGRAGQQGPPGAVGGLAGLTGSTFQGSCRCGCRPCCGCPAHAHAHDPGDADPTVNADLTGNVNATADAGKPRAATNGGTRPASGCACCCCCSHGGGTAGTGGDGTGVGQQVGPGWQPQGPGWGPPDDLGWQLWGEPFTLPVTVSTWPARYVGAPDPLTVPAPDVREQDIAEAVRRLTGLDLSAGMSHTEQLAHLARLRAECARLVHGWPTQPNFAVPLGLSPDGANAPQFSLRLVEYLQLAALSPYLARTVGLYFVDEAVDPGLAWDYCIVGVWPEFTAPVVVIPGAAPRGALAAGKATYDGLTITADAAISHLHVWQRGIGGVFAPTTDPGAPPEVAAAFAAAVAVEPTGSWPPAMLAAQVDRATWPWGLPPPPDAVVLAIALSAEVAEVALTVAGSGVVNALSAGAVVASAAYGSAELSWVTLTAPDPVNAPIDTLELSSFAGPASTVVVGSVAVTPVGESTVGVRYALVHAPAPMSLPDAPATPVAIFRRRDAGVELPGPTITARSVFDVQWVPPPGVDPSGDPVTDPMGLPSPDAVVGYLAEQTAGDPTTDTRLNRIIAAAPQPTPVDSPLLPAPSILRFMASGLPDPPAAYQFRTAGFGVFGQLGSWSRWSDAVGVERIAAAPSALRLISFDNTAAGGGAPSPAVDPTAWVGGTLSVEVVWSAGALLAYPDARTARLTVSATNPDTGVAATLATADVDVPQPAVAAYTLTGLVADPDPARGVVYAITTPPLPALDADAPAASLTLTGQVPGAAGSAGGTVTERFTVRPGLLDAPLGGRPAGVVATLPGGPVSRLTTNPDAFVGQPAYLVQGVTVPVTVAVPLVVPIDQQTARGQASVTASRAVPFDPDELITDPNDPSSTRAEPAGPPVGFVGAQRLVPPPPPTPVHLVDHRWYSPADATGAATYVFAGSEPDRIVWDTSAGLPAVSGYLLERAAVRALALTDVKRRLTAGLTDPNPAVAGRADLSAWIADLPDWLAAYNTRTYGTDHSRYLSPAAVLTDAAGQRAFVDHFYGGLLDDELCVLADVPGNARAFARVDHQGAAPGSTLTDTVNGTGYGRTLYALSAVNLAGSVSVRTGAAGPVYTRAVRASRAPVLYRVQPALDSLIVAWALDDNPDVAGYLVYRADDPAALADLRWWGPDPTHPADPATLAAPVTDPLSWQGFALTAGPVDPRLVAVVPDPRIFARDHADSDMAEIPLPPGTAPEEILGVYRLDEFAVESPPQTQPQAFDYWRPDTGTGSGTAQVSTTGSGSTATSRITGLRVGLGRSVPVVVVARYGNLVRVLGSLGPAGLRRLAFVDATLVGSAPPAPADTRAARGWTAPDATATNFYTVVAVDIAGNRSAPATPFGARALAPAGT
jgi:hypothetical protein